MTKISVENIGPIVSGEVDLKPLTIFIGPSNTGKSFLATMIYSLAQIFYHPAQSQFSFMVPSSRRGLTRSLGTVDAEVRLAFDEWDLGGEVDDHGVVELNLQEFPPAIARAVEESVNRQISQVEAALKVRFDRTYGGLSDVVKRGSDVGRLRVSNPALTMEFDLRPSKLELGGSFDVDSIVPVQIPAGLVDDMRMARHDRGALPEIFVDLVSGQVLDRIGVGLLSSDGYYLPAARSGVIQAYKTIVGSIARGSSPSNTRREDSSELLGCVSDFISHLITMGTPGPSKELREVVSFIESEISQGVVDFDDSQGLPFPDIKYLPSGDSKSFRIARSSSMVSDLAPLILFLKYLVQPGDLLILEEPEAHLHPAAQRQMARALVRLVNAGVKVLITTHSEFMLSQINNLMRLSLASRQTIRKYGYAPQDCLSQDDVSAHAFRLRDEHDGSTVEELQIDPDVGIDEDEFAVVASDLYDETVSFQRIRFK